MPCGCKLQYEVVGFWANEDDNKEIAVSKEIEISVSGQLFPVKERINPRDDPLNQLILASSNLGTLSSGRTILLYFSFCPHCGQRLE